MNASLLALYGGCSSRIVSGRRGFEKTAFSWLKAATERRPW
jgi:hypothetical protein